MPGNLWAPWRMEYILGDKSGPCVFCEPRSTEVLVMQPLAFVCLNKYPFAAGHVLVIPRRHVSELEGLSEEEAGAFFRLLHASVGRLRRALSPDGVNVGLNLGRAAGAGIADHLHAHLVPRWTGDTNFMPVIADLRVMPEYLAQTRERLLPFFADL